MLHPDRRIDGIHELRRKNGARLRGPFRHTNVTVIFLSLYRVLLRLALEPECRRSVFLERVQSGFSQRNNVSRLANRNHCLRNVIASDGSQMRTWVRVDATPQRCWIFYAKTISKHSTSSAT